MSKQMETFKEWVRGLREDVTALKKVVESKSASEETRRYAATALNYVVAKMDLVPDWEDSIGVVDDAMFLRVCASLAAQHPSDGAGADVEVTLGRLSNQVDTVESFLGAPLYAKFRRHVEQMTETAVRSRTPRAVVEEASVRSALFEDVDAELKRLTSASFAKLDELEIKLKSYLQHKLK